MFNNYNFTGKTILITEDERTNYLFLEALLKRTGATLIWAETGKTALEAIKNSPEINLVLMDIKMPEMNGYEATREIKKLRPELPIIAQTAYALAGEKEKILSAGCDDYLSKPIMGKVLLEKIDIYLKKSN
ncbi:MAG: response regulator [Bacteroidetes bacterium HGW-Bacteroidetes-4]|jgi:CheY-like chemotaxis protein|nr:MAG: response regulator [Bacteroidetes bacterium HGW-Bacteroidetes-4]